MPNWKVLKDHLRKEGVLQKVDIVRIIKLAKKITGKLTS